MKGLRSTNVAPALSGLTVTLMLFARLAYADCDILTFGASPTKSAAENRVAIQKAVDAATAKGERVIVPPGAYKTGTIVLKSNVELHLEKGARLVGSTDKRDYNADDAIPGNPYSVAEEWSGAHLIYAYQAEHVAITGEGVIDGSGPAFFGDSDEDSRFPWYKYGLKLNPIDRDWYRPGIMIYFAQCRDIRLEDISFVNTPCWTCHVRCSDGLVARRVKIDADRTIANSDGFSIDCTRNALVEQCVLKTGDDGVAIRASCAFHFASNACENVTVRDCDIWSCCCGFRFGVGNGTIRNVLVENCRIHEAADGLDFTPSFGTERGTAISNVVFRNLSVRECGIPVACGGVRNALFENCDFEGMHPVDIRGEILFRNCAYRRIVTTKTRHHGMKSIDRRRARQFCVPHPGVVTENCKPSGKRPGVLVLAFDDRNFQSWVGAIPLFAKYNAHATFFLSGEILENKDRRCVKRLVDAGHAIGLHGQTHMDVDTAFKKIGVDAYRKQELSRPLRQIYCMQMQVGAFGYPNNRHNDETDRELLKTFKRLRAGVPGVTPYDPKGEKQAGQTPLYTHDDLFFPADDLPKHKVILGATIGEAYHTKIDDVLKCLERAAKNREVVEFTSHAIAPNAKSIHMKTEWLEAILAKAQELGLEVLSFDELD